MYVVDRKSTAYRQLLNFDRTGIVSVAGQNSINLNLILISTVRFRIFSTDSYIVNVILGDNSLAFSISISTNKDKIRLRKWTADYRREKYNYMNKHSKL